VAFLNRFLPLLYRFHRELMWHAAIVNCSHHLKCVLALLGKIFCQLWSTAVWKAATDLQTVSRNVRTRAESNKVYHLNYAVV